MTWHPEPLGDGVRRELHRLDVPAGLEDVLTAWAEAVGPAIAANAWPARQGRDGTLHVATSSSTWAFELGHLEAQIRARLAQRLGAAGPSRLRFSAGRLPERGSETVERSSRSVPKVSPWDREAGAEIAAGIRDEALRGLVARAAAASLARARGGEGDRRL